MALAGELERAGYAIERELRIFESRPYRVRSSASSQSDARRSRPRQRHAATAHRKGVGGARRTAGALFESLRADARALGNQFKCETVKEHVTAPAKHEAATAADRELALISCAKAQRARWISPRQCRAGFGEHRIGLHRYSRCRLCGMHGDACGH
jgi:hypothetical protein